MSDATELAVEFFRARADNGRSDAPAIALLMAKLAARGDDAIGGEYGGSGFLRCAGTGAARGLRFAAALSGPGVPRGLEPPRTPLLVAFRALLIDRSMAGAAGAAAARAFSVFFRLPCGPAPLLEMPNPRFLVSGPAVSAGMGFLFCGFLAGRSSKSESTW